jgi:hypothetical protein
MDVVAIDDAFSEYISCKDEVHALDIENPKELVAQDQLSQLLERHFFFPNIMIMFPFYVTQIFFFFFFFFNYVKWSI